MMTKLHIMIDTTNLPLDAIKAKQIVKEYLGEEIEEERIALKDLIGKAYVTDEFKDLLDEVVKKNTNSKKITKTKRWNTIKELLMDYLDK